MVATREGRETRGRLDVTRTALRVDGPEEARFETIVSRGLEEADARTEIELTIAKLALKILPASDAPLLSLPILLPFLNSRPFTKAISLDLSNLLPIFLLVFFFLLLVVVVILLAVFEDIIFLPISFSQPTQLIPDHPSASSPELLPRFPLDPFELICGELPGVGVLVASSVHPLLEENCIACLDGDEEGVDG